MKNEQRHKRSQNDLARIIGKIQPHSATIMRSIMIVLIAVLFLAIWRSFSKGNKADFYNDVKVLANYGTIDLNADQLDELVKTYTTKYLSGQNHAHVSLLIGNIYLNNGSLARDEGNREKAVQLYEEALKYLKTADTAALKRQDLTESAVWGLAQTCETLASLKEGPYAEEAIGYYDRLLEKWPDGTYAELAKQQRDFLKRSSTSVFIAKYRETDPMIFSPNFQTPGVNEPDGDVDTTIIPGTFDSSGLLDLLPENATDIEFDPGLTVSEPEEQEGDTPQAAETIDATETTQEPATESAPETTEDIENEIAAIPLHRYYDMHHPEFIR